MLYHEENRTIYEVDIRYQLITFFNELAAKKVAAIFLSE